MKKKIFLGMGSLLLATSSTMVVVSCSPKVDDKNGSEKTPTKPQSQASVKKTPTKLIEKYNGQSAIGNLIHGFLPGLLKDNAQKENILENVDKILAGGISKVKDADLKAILKSFKVSDSLSGIILKLLKSDLLERIFVKGFADIQTEYKALHAKYKEAEEKYKLASKEADAATSGDEKKQKQEQAKKDLDNAKKIFNNAKKESVKTFVESVLDAPQKGDIFTRELLTKLLVGFDDAEDFSSNLYSLLEKAGIDVSVIKIAVKLISFLLNPIENIYNDTQLFKNGLLILDKEGIKNIFSSIKEIYNYELSWAKFKVKDHVPKNIKTIIEKVLNSYNNIDNDKLSQSVQSLIHGGLKSLKGKDNDDLITFIEYVSGKKDIPTAKAPSSATGTSKEEDPTIVKTIADILINNSEDIYTFLKYGFSQDNWKELQDKLFDILSPLVANLIF